MSERSVPPVPYKTPLANQNGFISESWAKFFRQVFYRIGGNNALTNIELESTTAADVAALDLRVDALETLTTSHTSSISNINTSLNDILQGRQL